MVNLTIELKSVIAASNLFLHPDAPLELHDANTGDELIYQAATEDDRKEGTSGVICLAKGRAPLSAAETQFLQEITERRIPSSVASANLDDWSFLVGRGASDTRPVTRDELLDPK